MTGLDIYKLLLEMGYKNISGLPVNFNRKYYTITIPNNSVYIREITNLLNLADLDQDILIIIDNADKILFKKNMNGSD